MTKSITPERKLTAVIVTYQSAHTVGRTLDAARRCFDAGLLDCVIVDNGSSDGTAALLERAGSWADVVLTGRNNGFGRGCNIGFARVQTPYAVFINPDAVVEPDAIRTMLQFIEARPSVGIVGPAILEGDKAFVYRHFNARRLRRDVAETPLDPRFELRLEFLAVQYA